MLVRFFRIVVIFLGFSLAAPFQPASAQEQPIHRQKDKNGNPVVKAEREPSKQPSRAAPALKTTPDSKESKGSRSTPPANLGPRGVSRTERSSAARQAFERQTGYANGRPGYMVEHIVPLSCGGTDTPGNMQWLTLAEARRKNKLDRTRCR
jgi:hypothetical protein